jgi:superfamily II DNA or RNA helicase
MGMYHEKIGYFRDGLGDVLAFGGSANETYNGLLANFESIDVYPSWTEPERAARIVDSFDRLWSDETKRLKVVSFPDVARDLLSKYLVEYGDEPLTSLPDRAALPVASTAGKPGGQLTRPRDFTLRPYQEDAIKAWLSQHGRGILKMATGTGKTKTALTAASHLARVEAGRDKPLVIVVVAPYQHLVDQWAVDVAVFGVAPILVYESSAKWVPLVESALNAAKLGRLGTVVLIATNVSFASDKLQAMLARVQSPLLLIGDEVHNLGAAGLRSKLPPTATYRLGLSATPERWFDESGTNALLDYFGPIAFEMDLERAIELRALCSYEYFPRLIELDDDEMAIYVALSAKIAALMATDETSVEDPDSPLGALLRQRAGVLGHASGKLPALEADLGQHRKDWYQLVYCAEGYKRDEDGAVVDDVSQLRQVTNLIGTDLGLSCHAYVADTPRRTRLALMRRFETGEDLRFLVAMRCLDEGVDIPDARVGYLLASSSNPRQFIQRRGRLLRPAPGKDHAVIYDYLAVPQSGALGGANFELERRLLTREMTRASEFGRLSRNYEDSLRALRPLKERYGLMDL